MLNISISAFTKPIVQQRRFKYLLIILVSLAILLGLFIVPIESRYPEAKIKDGFDGIWWTIITITGVGYGDMVPISHTGKLMGMALAVVGAVAFGLLIAIFSLALEETKDKYYRKKLFERLEIMEQKLDKIEKHNDFMVKNNVEETIKNPVGK